VSLRIERVDVGGVELVHQFNECSKIAVPGQEEERGERRWFWLVCWRGWHSALLTVHGRTAKAEVG
jgi:hypothetical protein